MTNVQLVLPQAILQLFLRKTSTVIHFVSMLYWYYINLTDQKPIVKTINFIRNSSCRTRTHTANSIKVVFPKA